MAKKKIKAINILNRQAKHEYYFLNKFEAGIMLYGTEIKSIRAGHANLKEAYCLFLGGELYVRGLHIAEYSYGTYNNHEAKRDRKLLMRKSELKRMKRRTAEKGFTIVPLRLYISERGFAKLEIAEARGKKEYDKRQTIKDRENKRSLDRIKKIHRLN